MNGLNLVTNHKKILAHLQKIWLQPWSHNFVKRHTNQVLHLETTTIQRARSAHGALKAQLGFSIGDFFTALNSIELILKNQLIDWQQKLAAAKNYVAHKHRITMFFKLITRVPAYGL